MLHHVEIYVSDLNVSYEFWSELLGRIGYKKTSHWDTGFTLGIEGETYLTFVQVEKHHLSRPYHRCGVGLNHLAFSVKGRDAIDALRAFCLGTGITNLYDERYPFANGGSDYYALFIEDPDRIKVEFVAH